MPTDLAAPDGALALALTLLATAGTGGYLRARHDPDRSAGLLIALLVLGLTMAASVVIWEPPELSISSEREVRR